jgi:hypothetical protein
MVGSFHNFGCAGKIFVATTILRLCKKNGRIAFVFPAPRFQARRGQAANGLHWQPSN